MSMASRTGSSRGTFRRNGEVLAYTHPTAGGTYEAKTRRVPTSTMKESYVDPTQKEPLVKYHPLALRNRLPVVFDNAPIPMARFCKPRNTSSVNYNIMQGQKPPGFNQYLTTHKNYYSNEACQPITNDTNQGIVSHMAKVLHAKQVM